LGYEEGEVVAVCHRDAQDGGFTSRLVSATADAVWAEASRWVDSSDLWWSINPLAVPEGYGGRGTAEHVTRFAAVYADLDVKPGGLPSMAAAWEVIDVVSTLLGHEPVVEISSGHGLQPVWPIDPADERSNLTADDKHRSDARAIMRRFGRLVAHVAETVTEEHRGHVDSVFDPARVLRLPGSVNRKVPGAPVPTGVTFPNGSPLGVAELDEQLTAYGVEERPEDRDSPGVIRSEPGSWAWAEAVCPYAAKVITGWRRDAPGARHPWLVGQSVRLAAMHRNGCLTEELHARGVQTLAERMTELCAGGQVRRVAPGEVADALSWGRARAAAKTDADVLSELGGHKHAPPTVAVPAGGEHLAELWDQRPVFRHLHDFARARSAAPAAVLAAAVARAVAMVPPEYVLPPLVGSVGTLNQFFALVGKSGRGKGSATGAARDALELVTGPAGSLTAAWRDPIGKENLYSCDVGSGEGLLAGYVVYRPTPKPARLHRVRACVMFNVPEVDHLAAVGGRQGATLLPVLRKAWSGEDLNSQYVDPAKRLRVDANTYRCVVLAGVQPRRAGVLLDDSDGGTPQRFVWLPTDDPGAPDVTPEPPEPLEVRLPPALTPGRRHVLAVCPEAVHAIKSARQRQLRGEGGDDLDSHRLYAQEKLAAGLAVLDEHLHTDGITAEDWRLAGAIMAASDAVRDAVKREQRQQAGEINRARGQAEAEREEVKDDAAVKRTASAIVRKLSPDEWITGAALRRRLDPTHRQRFTAAVERLHDAGLIDVEAVEHRGQPGYRYRRRR
jgi:hypothetical protein